jgi:transketolase
MALAGKLDKKDYRVYTILGDGELQEGQVWEAALTSAHQKLDNLTAFVDWNNLQIDGNVCDVKNVYPIDKKFEAFGWNIINIDGHNFEEILDALSKAKEVKGKPTMIVAKTIKGKPTVIIASTVKGKGISFIENNFYRNICVFNSSIW